MPHKEIVLYKKLDGLVDNTTLELLPFLKSALPWIREALIEPKHRILIHCAAGQSRSGSVMVAYLMWSERMKLDAALLLAKSKRPIISPNPGFLEQLATFEVNEFRLE